MHAVPGTAIRKKSYAAVIGGPDRIKIYQSVRRKPGVRAARQIIEPDIGDPCLRIQPARCHGVTVARDGGSGQPTGLANHPRFFSGSVEPGQLRVARTLPDRRNEAGES